MNNADLLPEALEENKGKAFVPRVQDHSCYRAFLRAYYEWKKSERASFSYREFSARSGLKSPNYLQLVIQGDRNLQEATAVRVAKAMGLSSKERAYFVSLVALENAVDANEKSSAEKNLRMARSRLLARAISSDQKEILSNPLHLIVRELALFPGFEASPEWISGKLLLPVTHEQILDSLDRLFRVGLLQRKDHKVVTAEAPLNTGDAFDPDVILEFHRRAWREWARILELSQGPQREMGLINIPIGQSKIPELKQRIRQFQDEIIGWLEAEKDPDSMVQLGVVMVPVTK